MKNTEPIVFQPFYMERVWGGRSLETVFHRSLPGDQPFGESWELVDRPEVCSQVASGSLAGKSLEDLWNHHRDSIFGEAYSGFEGPFPILVKILDARDRLSIQVHPPAEKAEALGGEPKTEMWYVARADPDAKLYIGLKKGTTKETFRAAIDKGTTEEAVHVLKPKAGDHILIQSGRLHAIGAGLLLFEIQQNSDTTYRVFDWNRPGLDGKPRDLHIDESMQCIDFSDMEPEFDKRNGECLATCPWFHVEELSISNGDTRAANDGDRFSHIIVVNGRIRCGSSEFREGDSFLMPVGSPGLRAESDASVLRSTLPVNQA